MSHEDLEAEILLNLQEGATFQGYQIEEILFHQDPKGNGLPYAVLHLEGGEHMWVIVADSLTDVYKGVRDGLTDREAYD